MKKMKRTLSILLSLVLLLGCFPAVAMAAEDPNQVFTPDSTAPEVLDVTFSAAAVNAGEKLEVIVKAKDDLSGVQYASLYFMCEETGKGMDVYAESYHWDQETGKETVYPEGELHGWVEVSPYMQGGTYVLTDISTQDNAQNYISLAKHYDPEYYGENAKQMPASLAQKQFQVVNNGKIDTGCPVLTGLELSATNVEAPGTIEITLSATDDISGLKEANIYFRCAELGTGRNCWLESTYWNGEAGKYVPYEDGKLHGTMRFTAFDPSATYELEYISMSDNAQNHAYYSVDVNPEYADPSYGPIPACVKQKTITVTNSGKVDAAVPELKNISLELTAMKRPGTIAFEASTTENSAKLNAVDITYLCEENGKRISCFIENYHWDAELGGYVANEDGSLQGIMEISKYLEPGVYELNRIAVYDEDYNYSEYYARNGDAQLDAAIAKIIPQNKIYIGTAAENAPADPKPTEPKPTEPAPSEPETPSTANVFRLAGSNRYETGFLAADAMKETLGVDKFSAVVVASGKVFPDALAGSYLAAQKNAPILLVNDKMVAKVKEYIAANLAANGTVYLLGGEAAVPAAMETALKGFNVERLAGANRYETNLKILEEAGTAGQEILICTGKGFADSLSASAVNKPILLVKSKLTEDQKAFLKASSGKFVIIGGESAVSADVAAELKAYGTVERVSGANRYETSVAVAKRFFDAPGCAVLAYAKNFPDGLCGGPLAYTLRAPLILTATGKEAQASAYAKSAGITTGIVLGGESLISDAAAGKVFG